MHPHSTETRPQGLIIIIFPVTKTWAHILVNFRLSSACRLNRTFLYKVFTSCRACFVASNRWPGGWENPGLSLAVLWFLIFLLLEENFLTCNLGAWWFCWHIRLWQCSIEYHSIHCLPLVYNPPCMELVWLRHMAGEWLVSGLRNAYDFKSFWVVTLSDHILMTRSHCHNLMTRSHCHNLMSHKQSSRSESVNPRQDRSAHGIDIPCSKVSSN